MRRFLESHRHAPNAHHRKQIDLERKQFLEKQLYQGSYHMPPMLAIASSSSAKSSASRVPDFDVVLVSRLA